MSRPKYKWWSYVRWAIKLYPDRVAEIRRRQAQSITPNYNAMPGGSDVTRVTENLGMVSLGATVDREITAVEDAIHETHKRKDGDMRMALINMVYWEKSHTLPGACMKLCISEGTGRNWNAEFVYLVAKGMGVFAPGDWRGN